MLSVIVAIALCGNSAVSPAKPLKKLPHIIMHLADDYGWANAGWHRPEGYQEVQTPALNQLVKEGIELDQAYSFEFCSPTRSSLQSGRLPVHVNMVNADMTYWNPEDPVSGFAGIPRNMTGIAAKLKSAGYLTHQVGKWDAGMATVDHTPHGRGYDTSLGYFHHANNYWNEDVGAFVDLYNETETTTWVGAGPDFKPTNGPAYGINGSCSGVWENKCEMTGPEEVYEEFKFMTRNLAIINAHDASDESHPLFLCYTSHIVHEPLQVPNETWHKFDFISKSKAGDYKFHRQTYHAMVTYMDGVVEKMVAALKAKNMWENTIWFFQSDNGGPSFSGSSHTANNYPLKGSKMTNWQGGIRVNAFVSGGLLASAAPQRIGSKLEGFTHICDFYATWCAIAGVNATDERAAKANLPAIDGLNLWPYLSGQVDESPRKEVFAHPNVLLLEINKTKWKIFGDGRADFPFYDPDRALTPTQALTPTHTFAELMGTQGVAKPNCSDVEKGMCLKRVKAILERRDYTDPDKCCQACLAREDCITWNVNTKLGECFLRGASGPRDPGAECTAGQTRPYTPPPPGPVGHVSVPVACWMGPQYPNATTNPGCNSTMQCPQGCLFNLDQDPTEHVDVAAAHPDVLAVITKRLRELQPTVFSPNRGSRAEKASKEASARGGYWGPFVFP